MEIKDSGARREFDTGAVRDIQDGKGRCDLLPLDVVSSLFVHAADNYGASSVLREINDFTESGRVLHLMRALECYLHYNFPFADATWSTLFIELSKHFEAGCKKYGENNWRKGIPAHCYIDSALRHFFKFLRGDDDEPHNRAFAWNIVCCIWTCTHKPELNDYAKESQE